MLFALVHRLINSLLRSTLISRWTRVAAACSLLAFGAAESAVAQLIISGSPTFNSSTNTGLRDGDVPVGPGMSVNNSGVAVGVAQKIEAAADKGQRAVRWDSNGTAVELGNLGTGPNPFNESVLGYTYATGYAINDAGITVGSVDKYVAGEHVGSRAVRWAAGVTTATELGGLGTSFGYTDAAAFAVNASGVTVGQATKFDGSGNWLGNRAVRWNAGSPTAVELGVLGTSNGSTGETTGAANAINAAGVAVGFSEKYTSNVWKGTRAVRWTAGGAVTELLSLGTSSGTTGESSGEALAINEAGLATGWSAKYLSNIFRGERAVRWATNGTATELLALSTHPSGEAYSRGYAINAAGTVVGESDKYVNNGGNIELAGKRAVRWNSSGSTATELAILSTGTSEEGVVGYSMAEAYAVNDAGTAVGYAARYVAQQFVENRAVLWLPNASIVDLNTLGLTPNPLGGSWVVLHDAKALSADGWVAGTGTFQPASGAAYQRNWVTQVGLGGNWTSSITGTLTGTWGRGRQWSTGTPAMQVGDAVFNASSTYTVSLDRNEKTRTIAVTAGNVTINFGSGFTLTATSGVSVSSGATFGGAGTIIGNVTNSGIVAPTSQATPLGTLVVNGTYGQTATGKLQMQIGASGYDRLQVSGSFGFGGTLEVLFTGGYMPTAGAEFDILDFSTHTGTFNTPLQLPTLDPGLEWNTDALYTTGVLSVTSGSDWNGDGHVNALDYVVLRMAGASQTQYESWRANYGASFGSGASAAMPEPGAILIFATAGVAFVSRRRGRDR